VIVIQDLLTLLNGSGFIISRVLELIKLILAHGKANIDCHYKKILCQ